MSQVNLTGLHLLSEEEYNKKLLDLLAKREGKENTIYVDSKGIPTIGIGIALLTDTGALHSHNIQVLESFGYHLSSSDISFLHSLWAKKLNGESQASVNAYIKAHSSSFSVVLRPKTEDEKYSDAEKITIHETEPYKNQVFFLVGNRGQVITITSYYIRK